MDEIALKVKSDSNPHQLAGAINKNVQLGNIVNLRCIGASSISQATKAIAIARGYAAPTGIDLVCRPGFFELQVETLDADGKPQLDESGNPILSNRTGIRLDILRR